MVGWGPVVIAMVLFMMSSPGLLFQLPRRNKVVEFGISILIHTIIFFGLITIFLIAIGVLIYMDDSHFYNSTKSVGFVFHLYKDLIVLASLVTLLIG